MAFYIKPVQTVRMSVFSIQPEEARSKSGIHEDQPPAQNVTRRSLVTFCRHVDETYPEIIRKNRKKNLGLKGTQIHPQFPAVNNRHYINLTCCCDGGGS